MTYSPEPFISLQDLSDHLGRDVNQDPDALAAIDAACDMVRTVSGQPFNAGTATLTFDGTGTDALLLPYLPVTAAGTVTVNGGTVTDYCLNDNGILFRGTAGQNLTGLTWPAGRQNVRVTFNHGYPTTDFPRDVRRVALEAATRLVVQGAAVEESLGEARVKYAGPAMDLTVGDRLILNRYRHMR